MSHIYDPSSNQYTPEESKQVGISRHPVELEAIARVAKVAYDLNKVLKGQDFDAIEITWVATSGGKTVAIAASENPEEVAFL